METLEYLPRKKPKIYKYIQMNIVLPKSLKKILSNIQDYQSNTSNLGFHDLYHHLHWKRVNSNLL